MKSINGTYQFRSQYWNPLWLVLLKEFLDSSYARLYVFVLILCAHNSKQKRKTYGCFSCMHGQQLRSKVIKVQSLHIPQIIQKSAFTCPIITLAHTITTFTFEYFFVKVFKTQFKFNFYHNCCMLV